jgi:hypothetical protein
MRLTSDQSLPAESQATETASASADNNPSKSAPLVQPAKRISFAAMAARGRRPSATDLVIYNRSGYLPLVEFDLSF